MREILFRGKRADNGEWIYGDLRQYVKNQNGYDFYQIDTMSTTDNDFGGGYTVMPQTIGQFTGLFDKHGNKIFEGDIVAINTANNVGNINGFTGIVVYHDCGYELQNIEDMDCHECMWYDNEELEIIGNIHDNPEILKVK